MASTLQRNGATIHLPTANGFLRSESQLWVRIFLVNIDHEFADAPESTARATVHHRRGYNLVTIEPQKKYASAQARNPPF